MNVLLFFYLLFFYLLCIIIFYLFVGNHSVFIQIKKQKNILFVCPSHSWTSIREDWGMGMLRLLWPGLVPPDPLLSWATWSGAPQQAAHATSGPSASGRCSVGSGRALSASGTATKCGSLPRPERSETAGDHAPATAGGESGGRARIRRLRRKARTVSESQRFLCIRNLTFGSTCEELFSKTL